MGNCICSGDESKCSTPIGGLTFKHCAFSCTRRSKEMKIADIQSKIPEYQEMLERQKAIQSTVEHLNKEIKTDHVNLRE